mgnify:CR=1 FL=1
MNPVPASPLTSGIVPLSIAMCILVSGESVPIPTRPAEVIRIFSVAASLAPVPNIKSVELTLDVNSAVANALISAPAKIASVPLVS